MCDLCLCGSGNKYADCCERKPNPFETEKTQKKLVAELMKLRSNYKKMCLYPNCSNKGINAHTISQKAVLSLIADNDHVLMPIVKVGQPVDLIPQGIEKQASTYFCFCSTHDDKFSCIDVVSPKLSDHIKFMYAYRAFASTYYKVQRELFCLENQFSKYNMTQNIRCVLMLHELRNNMLALEGCKSLFDNAVTSENYSVINSEVVSLDYKVYLSAAACFCPAFDLYGSEISYEQNKLPMLYLSIIPGTSKTDLIFSWLKNDNEIYENFAKQLSIAPRRFVLKYLNNLLPLYCENITIGPKLWNKWDSVAQNDFRTIIDWGLTRETKISSSQLSETHKYNLFLKIDDEKKSIIYAK